MRLPTLSILLLTSVIFGYLHGGIINVFLQGVGGLAYGILFLKFCQGGKRILEASALVIILHFLYDFIIFALFV